LIPVNLSWDHALLKKREEKKGLIDLCERCGRSHAIRKEEEEEEEESRNH